MELASERIQNRVSAYGDSETVELICLDDIRIRLFDPIINIEIARCKSITYLTLNRCQITSLENFPPLPTLICLQLIENKIRGPDLIHLTQCQRLSLLALNKNKIEHVEVFRNLEKLNELEHIEVLGNQVCNVPNYKQQIFELLPYLRIINRRDRHDNLDESRTDQSYNSSDESDIESYESDSSDGSQEQEESEKPTMKYRRL